MSSTSSVNSIALAISSVQRAAFSGVLLLVAILFSLPFLITAHRYPLTTFDSDWISASALALALLAAATAKQVRIELRWPLPALTLVLLVVAAVQYLLGMLHYSFTLSSLFMYLCTLLCAYVLGRWLVASDLRQHAIRSICIALMAAGLLSVVVQVLQVFDVRALPTWLMFPLTDKLSSRRPFGNLAQPNQLATYLVWATLATMVLMRRGTAHITVQTICAILFAGIALTGSRMGSLFAMLLVALALVPNELSADSARGRIKSAAFLLVGYGLGLALARMFLVDPSGTMATALERYGEGSFGQRVLMWSDALQIALSHPWLGVGVGEYGDAQYQLAQPGRDLVATNNPHNLFLHIGAEFGIPVGLLVLGVVGWWCWTHSRTNGSRADLRAIFLMIGFVLVHSLLEYPLWHLYFLVATGLLVALVEPDTAPASAALKIQSRFVFASIGVAALCATTVMKVDYDAIAGIWDEFLRERASGLGHTPELVASVMITRDSTYFRPQMERVYLELFPVQAQVGDENIELSARVLSRLADVNVIVRHIELLLQAARLDETAPHIARLKVFAGADYPRYREEIEQSVAENGAILDPVRRQLAEP